MFIPTSQALGELRVEILETDGLPQMDLLGNDCYAVVIFEDSLACTEVIAGVANPRWHEQTARAFRFPVFAPHSQLQLALFDCDEADVRNVLHGIEHALTSVEETSAQLLDGIK